MSTSPGRSSASPAGPFPHTIPVAVGICIGAIELLPDSVAVFAVGGIAALALTVQGSHSLPDAPRLGRLLWVAWAFFAAAVVSSLAAGSLVEGLEGVARFGLFPLAVLALRRLATRDLLLALWAGATVGASMAGVVAIAEVMWAGAHRPAALTNPILFGGLALMLGFVSWVIAPLLAEATAAGGRDVGGGRGAECGRVTARPGSRELDCLPGRGHHGRRRPPAGGRLTPSPRRRRARRGHRGASRPRGEWSPRLRRAGSSCRSDLGLSVRRARRPGAVELGRGPVRDVGVRHHGVRGPAGTRDRMGSPRRSLRGGGRPRGSGRCGSPSSTTPTISSSDPWRAVGWSASSRCSPCSQCPATCSRRAFRLTGAQGAIGAAGLGVVGGFAVLALTEAVFERSSTLVFYAVMVAALLSQLDRLSAASRGPTPAVVPRQVHPMVAEEWRGAGALDPTDPAQPEARLARVSAPARSRTRPRPRRFSANNDALSASLFSQNLASSASPAAG